MGREKKGKKAKREKGKRESKAFNEKGFNPFPLSPFTLFPQSLYFTTALMPFRASSALSKAPISTQRILPLLSTTMVTG